MHPLHILCIQSCTSTYPDPKMKTRVEKPPGRPPSHPKTAVPDNMSTILLFLSTPPSPPAKNLHFVWLCPPPSARLGHNITALSPFCPTSEPLKKQLWPSSEYKSNDWTEQWSALHTINNNNPKPLRIMSSQSSYIALVWKHQHSETIKKLTCCLRVISGVGNFKVEPKQAFKEGRWCLNIRWHHPRVEAKNIQYQFPDPPKALSEQILCGLDIQPPS